MYIDYTRLPFIDIPLPPAIILPAYKLIALYVIVALIDFFLLRHNPSFVSSKQLRIVMSIYHIMIPMIFISSIPTLNILYAACPWFLASYSAHMSHEQLTFMNWCRSILAITIEDKEHQYTPTKIRLKGAAKVALGLFKIAFCRLIIDPVLPRHSEYALEYPWLHPYSMIYTVLYGVKGYCYLGVVDVFMGLEQLIFGWNMVNLFNSPILSSSPRDFWSRRWNRIVHNLLHEQVFSRRKAVVKGEDQSLNISENSKETTKVTPATKRVTRSSTKKEASQETGHLRTKESQVKSRSRVKKSQKIKGDNDSKGPPMKQKCQKSFWSTRRGKGLLAFVISGIFHELIIMSACRRITLEHFVFFTLQGVFCMIEVDIRQGALKQEPTGKTRVLCIALHLLLMSVFGRLFTAPLLRHNFF